MPGELSANRIACYRRLAFTLVEVLVVVAIIAVLISLLLPILNRARGTAQQMHCATNLRSIGQAFLSYTLDNNGLMPTASASNGVSSRNWIFFQQGRDVNQSALAKYLSVRDDKLRDLFRCPVAPVDSDLGFRGGGAFPLTYTMNAFQIWSPDMHLPLIPNPSHKIAIYDENENADDDQFWYGTDRDTLTGRHGQQTRQVANINGTGNQTVIRGFGNVLYFDGHVGMVDNNTCHTAEANDPTKP